MHFYLRGKMQRQIFQLLVHSPNACRLLGLGQELIPSLPPKWQRLSCSSHHLLTHLARGNWN